MTTTAASPSDTNRPSLKRQLRGALNLESRLLRLSLVLLLIEVTWWTFAWLYLRGFNPSSHAILSTNPPSAFFGTVSKIQGISGVLVAVTPALLAILSLGPSIALQLRDKSASFSLTQVLTRSRWLALRLVPALIMGTTLSLVSGLAYNFLVGPHLLSWQRPAWAYFMLIAPVVVGVTVLLTLIAALLALLIKESLTTSAATLIVYLSILLLGFGFYPYLLPAKTATSPYLLVGKVALPSGKIITQIELSSPNTPQNSSVFSESYLLHGKSIPSQRIQIETEKCLPPNFSGGMPHSLSPGCKFLRSITFRQEYQPANNFYPLAWTLFGVLLLLSALVYVGIALYLPRLQL